MYPIGGTCQGAHMAIRIASPAAGRVHLKGGENVQKVMGASLGHGYRPLGFVP